MNIRRNLFIAQAWILGSMVVALILENTVFSKNIALSISTFVVQLVVSVLALVWQTYANTRDRELDQLKRDARFDGALDYWRNRS